MRTAPSNADDIIDSRDVIERIAELESERDDWTNDDPTMQENPTTETWESENPDEAEELKALKALAEEGSGSPDWSHGETLIADSYFEEYAQQLAEDIGAIPKELAWPACHIDWEAAADALKADYFQVDFDGAAYWIRS